MARTYFPTRNDNGVRDLSETVTLGGYLYTDYRAPAEPAAKGAMNPVTLGLDLGAIVSDAQYLARARAGQFQMYSGGAPNPGTPVPAGYSQNAPFINSDGSQWEYSAAQGRWVNVGTPYNLSSSAPSVSSQSTPTPQVRVNAVPQSNAVLVTSGGGTASPGFSSSGLQVQPTPAAGSTVNVTGAPSLTDQVAQWLSGSTPVFSYNVPNALLAGGFAIAVAMMLGGNSGRRR
jgi:hypothetical protein